MSNTNQTAQTSSKNNDEKSTDKSEKDSSGSSIPGKSKTVANEEMIKRAKRALLADAERFKQGLPTDAKRRPQTTMVNTQFLGRLLNQPNRGRISKPNPKKKSSSTKNKTKK